MKQALRTVTTALVVVLALSISGMAAEQTMPRFSIDISGHPFKGPANAPVTIVDFFDYL